MKLDFQQHLSIFHFFYRKKRMILRRNSYLCNFIIKSHKYAKNKNAQLRYKIMDRWFSNFKM